MSSEARKEAGAGAAASASAPGGPSAGPRGQERPPPWRDVRILRIVAQVVFVLLVGGVLWWLWSNLQTNLARSGITTGFDYLERPGGFDIRGSDYRPSQRILAAILVGLVNTIRVSAVGIFLALVIGTIIGIARLSSNWLVRKAAALYVETLRNVPVLVVIIFMYSAVILQLPAIQEAAVLLGLGVFSNRAVGVPWVEAAGNAAAFLGVLAAGLVAAVAVALVRTRRFDQTGVPHHRVLWGVGLFVLVAVVGFLALGGPVAPSFPALEGRLIVGGVQLAPAFAALLVALTLYTASHIAEIVRGSIQAVPKGQTEAANAIALSGFQRLRFIVLPQAFRIAVPPLANQFLNLTKNSSLAAFIGFPEMVTITNTIISNGNPAPQSIAILMLAYLVLSLLISLAANLVNRSLALEAR